MSTMFAVQIGVPIPAVNRAPKVSRRKYPIDTMAVGAMFFLPGRDTRSVSAYISRITKRVPGKFSARHCWMIQLNGQWLPADAEDKGATEGTGVWRVE